ncbi:MULTISPECIES: hypothetical protein [unclassified Streptomyces]|uniref:hypothetical protein n=1 Tax=unclassified Streptomyces TaxID=2593676 RepID=UPI002E3159E1|nr:MULTISPECIES: hypothetical protein [unclassified Streptomyces]WUC69161.1 hypothetical protein OG861_33500 [Streptomyces sp. NBC_00539]
MRSRPYSPICTAPTQGHTDDGQKGRIHSLSINGRRSRERWSISAQFFLDAATPCLADSLVQAPTAEPNTPVRTTPYPQRPDVKDDFWSATAPVPSGSPTP